MSLVHVLSDPVASRVEDVVGRQVQLPLEAGELIQLRTLKKPILVKRHEEIEVVARRGGIVIRSKVRAVDEGSLNDTIAVETLDGAKSRFIARVTGVQMAEVFVSNASATRLVGR